MRNYVKEIEGNNIIFKDITNNVELSVIHDNDENIFDTIIIDNKFNLSFIEYIVKELKKTNDLAVIYTLNNSIDLEKLLNEYGLRVSHYQYIIEYKDIINVNSYDINANLDNESKKYYLNMINNISMNNNKYFNPNSEYIEFDDTWFNNEFNYRVYMKNKKIVGVVDYQIFDNNLSSNNIFNYNNKLCIRCLFGEDKEIIEDIIKDLLNTYKKDISVNITYTENNLKEVCKKMGKFNYCEYNLVDK